VFEIQRNSDVTFRLYDWGHVDAKTGKLRELQVDQAMRCIDFAEGPVGRVTPVLESATPVKRERLFDCEYFRLWRVGGVLPFSVGAMGLPRVLVCIEGGVRLNMEGPLMLLEKEMFYSCRRRWGRVLFGHGLQLTCWKSHCPNSLNQETVGSST
jgi:mannose-6-phosphate isomerase